MVVTTDDGGVTWRRVASPASTLADLTGLQGSPHIQFADAHDGWIIGAGLWATHDGGATWKRANLPGFTEGARVADIAVAGDAAWVLSFGSETRLLRSPVAGDDWTEVPQTGVAGTGGRLAGSGSMLWEWVSGATANGTAISKLVATDDAGATWSDRPLPCPAPGAIALGDGIGLVACGGGSAAGSQEKQAYLTHDDGLTFELLTNPPFGGSLWGAGVRDADTLFVAAVSGATFLYGSSDAGGTWSTVFEGAGGGANLTDLAFTSATSGAFVLGYTSDVSGGQPSVLVMTSDGGGSWHAASVAVAGGD